MIRRSRAIWWGAFVALFTGVIAFLGGLSVALHWGADIPYTGWLGPTGAVRRATPPGLEDQFAVYWKTWDLVEQKFYRDKPLDHQKMIYASINGMLRSLEDEYTFFQEPEDASKMRESMEGQFEGIGAYIEIKDGQLRIVAPIEDSPAERAGLLPGDVVIKVDDTDLAPQLAHLDPNVATDQAIKLIRGPQGSKVKLTILRGEASELLEISIVRDAVPIITVNSKILADGVAYIQITQFEGTTTMQLDKALKRLLPQNPKGIILDLRNNPGGLLETAQEVLGRFVQDGPALYERFGNGEEKAFNIKRSMGAPTDFYTPMLVLVNAGSASASEIVAGALVDLKRALLLGEKTYGKGSVQSVEPLPDTSSARITIARWLTPNKTVIHKQGIDPAYYVPFDNNEQYRVPLPQNKANDPIQADDSQLFWAIKVLGNNETPPVVARPTPTAKP